MVLMCLLASEVGLVAIVNSHSLSLFFFGQARQLLACTYILCIFCDHNLWRTIYLDMSKFSNRKVYNLPDGLCV